MKPTRFFPRYTVRVALDHQYRGRLGAYVTTQDHHYWDDADGTHIVVPRGFRTDFASFPRVLWVFLAKDGPWQRAALYHDWLYRSQAVPQFKADAIFRNIMAADGVDERYQKAFFIALRLFGEAAYDAAGRRLQHMPGGELDLRRDLNFLALDVVEAAP
jgi:hypothetical protein